MKEKLATGGAVAAAAAASLCCIGPLLFVALGLGAFGASAAFETLRPYLLGAAVLLLACGFYRAYFRRADARCAPGEACVIKPAGRATRAALWVAAFSVLAFALSPYYAGALTRRLSTKTTQPEAAQPSAAHATFKVTGMTCAGCEATIKLALEQTPGVRGSEVSYDRGEAVVEYDPSVTDVAKIQKAIDGTGYTCEIKR
ncbi:MAG TPA: mercuric transporter MerT family protein [Pyrinomonadaceae bacterium]|nr:mercuric transporter MerT family protein [Pyrinomonadaceae bacterium]